MTITEQIEYKKHEISTQKEGARRLRLLAEYQGHSPNERRMTLELAESFESKAELLKKDLKEFQAEHGLSS